MAKIDDLLKTAHQKKASDLIITAGSIPALRIDRAITSIEHDALSPEDVEKLILPILTEEQQKTLTRTRELNFSYAVKGISRFRASIFFQRNSLGGVFRCISYDLPTMEDLSLPVKSIERIAQMTNGLVIVTGPMMSGKSTTIAAIIDLINQTQRRHIITIEDPIEHLYKHNQCIVEQREIGTDTRSFFSALQSAVRQSPDIIMIGEMRDSETVQAAIKAAETGILVLSTLYTSSAADTVNRIVDFFPKEKEQQIRAQLAVSLAAIIAQQLIPTTGDRGLIAACEILISLASVRTLIREGTTQQIQNVIDTGTPHGMQGMRRVLLDYLKKGFISKENFATYARDPIWVEDVLKEMDKDA